MCIRDRLVVVQRLGRVLDRVQLTDQRKHLGGAAAVGVLRFKELATRMCPAGDFDNAARVINPVVTAISVRLQVALVVAEPIGGTGPRPVGRVVVDDVRIGRIAQIGPEPSFATLSLEMCIRDRCSATAGM